MKKFTCVVLALLMLTMTTLTGCGKSSGNKSGKVTKLTFWTFVGLHADLWKNSAKKWNKEHPNEQIQLTATTYPYDDMHNKLQVAVQSGVGAPDIADIELGRFPNFLKNTPQLVDLSDVVADDKDKFVQSRLKIYSKDGKLYGLDYHVGTTVAFYNTDIFQKAGVDPKSISTWDDYIAAGKIVKEKTGKPMNYISQTALWDFDLMIGQQGSDIFDDKGNVTLDNETNVKTLQLLHNMIYTDKISKVSPGGQVDTEEAYGDINKGNVASIIMPFWYTSRFINYMPDLKGKILMAAPPVFKDGKYASVGLGGTGTAIPKQSKNVELAKKFLKFTKESQDAAKDIWTTLGFDPLRWDSWDDISKDTTSNKFTDYFENGNKLFDAIIPIKDKINSLNSLELSPTANDLLQSQTLYKVLNKNTDTADKALKSAADELRKKTTSK